jgi:DNA-binding MarR family transcriptional regulator
MQLGPEISATLAQWIEVFMHGSMRSFLLYAKQNNFSMTQGSVLMMLRDKGASSVSEIGDELQISNAAASQLLDRMVNQGLLMRAEDPVDRRLKQIRLSPQGYLTLQQGLQARQKWLEDLVLRLSPGEQEQVAAALKVLIDKANQLENY